MNTNRNRRDSSDSIEEPIYDDQNENSNAQSLSMPQDFRSTQDSSQTTRGATSAGNDQAKQGLLSDITDSQFRTSFFVSTFCLVYVIQDVFTRQSFAKVSADFIVWIQSWSINEAFLYTVSKIVSDSSFIVTGILILLVLSIGRNRLYAINFIICAFFTASIMSVFKLLYNDPRPYMQFPAVTPHECSAEYGNPSGHAMLNTFVALYGVSVLSPYALSRHKLACVIYGIFLFWVGFTRLHLGMHGINQIFLGWVYATLFFAVFRGLLFGKVNGMIIAFAQAKHSEAKITNLLMTNGFYIASSLAVLGIFMGVKDTYADSNTEWNQSIQIACNVSDVQDIWNKYLYNKCFIDAGVLGGSFGILVAILIKQGSIVDLDKYGIVVRNLSRKQRLKRLLAIIIAPLIVVAITRIVFMFVSSTEIYLRYFVLDNTTIYLTGFLLIFAAPIVLQKFNLDIKGDFLRNITSSGNPRHQSNDVLEVEVHHQQQLTKQFQKSG